ncbi:two-component system sensor histidine kinase NtrB [Haloarchaeobius sp. TZWSO28]|uniref:two-component system sensor histidine kinase NtrB n=1 Tax=Haloarchaeobius sp. TZWSO28 TaxID=3446119 RepID=UPI003EBD3FAE
MDRSAREARDSGLGPREAGYRKVIESANGYAIFTTSQAGEIETWPQTAAELYKYETSDIIGAPLDTLWAAGEEAPFRLSDLLANAREEPIEVEQWHERADGSVFWAICTVAPILNGGPHGFTIVSHDETARKQYQRMLERQNDRLKEFTDILSHDLRTPLSVVNLRLDLYRDTDDASHLDDIEAVTDRMERLIVDLLSVARQGGMVKNPVRTDLADVIETASVGTLPESATLLYDEVPPILASPDRLCQVFENLFRNAVDHGGETVTLRVGPLEDGFYVEDDGPGIPEEYCDNVFDHGFTTREDGHGFGLSVVRTIIGAHGWDIEATNRSPETSTDGGSPRGGDPVDGSSDGSAAATGARFEITNVDIVD